MRVRTNHLIDLMTVMISIHFSRVPHWERLTKSTKDAERIRPPHGLNKHQ